MTVTNWAAPDGRVVMFGVWFARFVEEVTSQRGRDGEMSRGDAFLLERAERSLENGRGPG